MTVTGWGRRVLAGSLLGAAFGALFGLVLARLLWAPAELAPPPTPSPFTSTAPLPTPTEVVPPTPSATTPAGDGQAAEDALVLIGALYALDGDLPRAQQRLSGLGLEDPAAALADLALRRADEGQDQLATDLATLAAALGQRQAGLLAYVASPTPTPTPTSTATPTATPTSRPSNTPTPTPRPSDTPTSPPTRRPATKATAAPSVTPAPPPTALPWDWWDHRVDLLEPPVRLLEANVAPGERYWRLVRLEWWKPGEGGNTLIYVTTLDEQGRPVWRQEVIVEHGTQELLYTDPKPGEPYGVNYPMGNTLNSYQVFVGGALPSDRVTGLGLGEWLGGMDHTTFVLIFQLTRK